MTQDEARKLAVRDWVRYGGETWQVTRISDNKQGIVFDLMQIGDRRWVIPASLCDPLTIRGRWVNREIHS